MHISANAALTQLKESGQLFLNLFEQGSLRVEMYKPDIVDLQQPHEQDEVYVILSGSGEFINGETLTEFQPGDFLFVPAGVEHRFINFTTDFASWVIFYGPKGGEKIL
ncbi:MAG: cupin domain-containing protein [Chitinophagaceae bacterium]|nr:cupin domain-containing protein [Chitinophagaceae bacterium]